MRLAELLLAGQEQTEAWDRAVEAATPTDVEDVLRLADHHEPAVRLAAVRTLPVLPGDEPSAAAVAACVRRSADVDPSVRDWSCFALGTMWRDVDLDALRGALLARLDDEHDDTRCEALVGLAYRRDPRVLPHVRATLQRDDRPLVLLEVVAAGALSEASFHELLLPHVGGWGSEASDLTVEAVVRLTDPDGLGEDLLEGVAALYRARAGGRAEDPGPWLLMDRALDIAPYRAPEALEGVLARLAEDEAGADALRERSALAQMAADA